MILLRFNSCVNSHLFGSNFGCRKLHYIFKNKLPTIDLMQCWCSKHQASDQAYRPELHCQEIDSQPLLM